MKKKLVHVVLTSRLDLLGIYPNGIVEIFSSKKRASDKKDEVNKKHYEEFNENIFEVESFLVQ